MRINQAPIAATLIAALCTIAGPALVEASVPSPLASSRVLKTTDPFTTVPQLDLPSLTRQLKAIEERRTAASECVALCELAAGIEARPFGRAVVGTPFGTQDAWGNYRFTSELAPSHNRFGFTGHYWDKEASLYYAKARYYDPFTARFTQADSFLGTIDDPPSLHRYFYANANPTQYVDEDGHSATATGAAVGFAWGVGQAIGGFWDDTFRGDYRRSFRDYASVVAQNTIAGAELGLAVDLAIASGGAGALPGVGAPVRAGIGALIGAGVGGLSFSGKDQAWGDFAVSQAVGAGAGAAIGLVPELVIAASVAGVHHGYQTIKEGNAASAVVGAAEIGASLLPYARQEGRQLAFGRLGRLLNGGTTKSGSPPQLSAGRAWEEAELASLGKAKNTDVWRPTPQDIDSAAFKVIVGPAKYTKGGRPMGTTVDIAETGGSFEIKGGTKKMESSYQLRLQTYRALKTDTPLTIRTTRPVNPTFSDWLKRWGVKVENPAPGAP